MLDFRRIRLDTVYSLYYSIIIFNVGKTSGMLSVCLTLWNSVNLALSGFRGNLLLFKQ